MVRNKYLYSVLRQTWLLVAAGLVLGALAGGIVGTVTPKKYEAGANVYFGSVGGANNVEVSAASSVAHTTVLSYAEIVRSTAILIPVAQELGLKDPPGQLSKRVSAEVVPNTSVLHVSVTASDPQQAVAINNAITRRLVKLVTELGPRLDRGSAVMKASVVTPATDASLPPTSSLTVFMTVGAFLGLSSSLSLIFASRLLQRRSLDHPEQEESPMRG